MKSAPPPASLDPVTAYKAVILHGQMKFCQVLAMVFAVCGFCIFAALYQNFIAPDPIAALGRLSSLYIVIFPFVPAIGLSLLAKRYEKQYIALITKR